jgi:acyl-CoA reductase-like NAD-dependent aldehyde dehydrogenase
MALGFLVLGALVGVLITLPGCSAFRGACADAVPTLSQGQSLVADAALALQDAEDAVQTLPPADRAKALDAIAKARTSLRAAAATLAAASTACSSPSLGEVFAAFAEAWTYVRPFVALLGGTGAASVREPIAAGRL